MMFTYKLIYQIRKTFQLHSELNYTQFVNFMCHTHKRIATEVTKIWLK